MWLRRSCLLYVPAFEDGNQRTLDLREGQRLSDLGRFPGPLVIRLIFVLLKDGLASGFLSPSRLVLVSNDNGENSRTRLRDTRRDHINEPHVIQQTSRNIPLPVFFCG